MGDGHVRPKTYCTMQKTHMHVKALYKSQANSEHSWASARALDGKPPRLWVAKGMSNLATMERSWQRPARSCQSLPKWHRACSKPPLTATHANLAKPSKNAHPLCHETLGQLQWDRSVSADMQWQEPNVSQSAENNRLVNQPLAWTAARKSPQAVSCSQQCTSSVWL